MADEATLRKWAFENAMDAVRAIHSDYLAIARQELRDAMLWLDQAIEAEQKREAAENTARILAAYTDLADVPAALAAPGAKEG